MGVGCAARKKKEESADSCLYDIDLKSEPGSVRIEKGLGGSCTSRLVEDKHRRRVLEVERSRIVYPASSQV